MKRRTFVLEIIIFALIVIFIIIPPFLTPSIASGAGAQKLLFDWSFPWSQLGLAVFALVLYFLLEKYLNRARKKFFFPSLLALSAIIFVALIIKFIVLKISADGKFFYQPKPEKALEWLIAIVTFLLSALYEEVIYRFYFPEELIRLFNLKFSSKLNLLAESLALLAFAFAHYYLGIPALINAFFAHIILRLLYIKTGLIWNCVIIHFFYNIISLILL